MLMLLQEACFFLPTSVSLLAPRLPAIQVPSTTLLCHPGCLLCLVVHSSSTALSQTRGGRGGHKAMCTHPSLLQPDGQKLVFHYLHARDCGRQRPTLSSPVLAYKSERASLPVRSGEQYREAVTDW